MRGRKLGYSLDHKVSVCYCFENNVKPEIASHVCNLEVVKSNVNRNKYTNSSITLEELLDEIKKYKNII